MASRKVHFVGSLPYSSTSEVFDSIPAAIPNLARLSDGEPGARGIFVMWQAAVFSQCPHVLHPMFQNGPLLDAASSIIKLNPTGYGPAAIKSYKLFIEAKKSGKIAANKKFLVCLPSPINVMSFIVLPQYQEEIEGMYEAVLLEDIKDMQAAIPAEELAIQFDIPIEILFLEYEKRGITLAEQPYDTVVPELVPWFSPIKSGILSRLSKLCTAVSPSVDLGFHLCYGDLAHTHFVQPTDMSTMVELANDLVKLTHDMGKKVAWVHMPVPKERKDGVFFAPLKDLKIGEGGVGEVYLGLVHAGDEEGTKERIEAAEKVLGELEFGVATECGCGRTTAEDFESILGIFKTISA